jgi:tetratricopeptide (TPR) repeat protein
MDRFSWFAWGVGISVVWVQPVALAKTAVQVNEVAQAITVKISAPSSSGSGILLQRQGDVYTVLTVAHVVKDLGASFTITAPDGKVYKPIGDSIRRYQGDVDLAVLKFRSTSTYKLSELGNSNQLKGGMELYVAGFPAPTQVITQSVFVFRRGQVTANSKKVFKNGYALLYDNDTLPGMSGGPILDAEGKVVGVHGKGDREEESRVKTGFNSGIPIARFADLAASLGVNLGTNVARTGQNSSPVADDYFVSAKQKYDQGNYRGALADYNRTIALNPKSYKAYTNRGNLKYVTFNDPQGALADYNQAIAINPKNNRAYAARAALKYDKLSDPQGALADFNQAIVLDPKYHGSYHLRGILKQNLKDYQGALADFNQAIALDPKFADTYYYRGFLKYRKLTDPQGALVDFNQAIALNPRDANSYTYRGSMKGIELKDYQGAVADLNQAIYLNPKLARAYGLRGLFRYEKLNDRAGGVADVRKCIKLARAQGNSGLLKISLKLLQTWKVKE